MFLKRSFLVISMASIMLLQGCSSSTVVENKVTLKLAEKVVNSELKERDGENVEFFGYMSIDHLDSDYVIITFNPEGLCPFHGELSTDEYRAIPVKLKEGYEKPENLYIPVKVEGIIKSGEFKDVDAHTFDLIIDDAVLTEVDVNKTTGILNNYIKLAEKGIFKSIRKQQVAIDEALGYKIFGKELMDLERIDIGSLEYAREIAYSVKDGSTDDLVTCIDYAIELGVHVNKAFEMEDLTLLEDSELVTKAYEMFELYEKWKLKYSV